MEAGVNPTEERDGLSGKPASLWVETGPEREFAPLQHDLTVDVAVLGAGITGTTAALLLSQAGVKVALIEAGRVGRGVTGYTTAKVTSLHGLTYAKLASSLGEEAARVYGEANEAGLALVARFVDELGIDCDFERRPAYTYTESREELDRIQEEVSIARQLGLPATYTESTDLPFAVAGAVRFDEQAQFHPVRYVAALANRISDAGSQVYETDQGARRR